MQESTPDSYQYSNNTTILCIWAWERCRPSVWKRLWKKNKKWKKRYLIDVQFSSKKKLATTQDRQTLQNADVKHIVSTGSYVWLFYKISRKQLKALVWFQCTAKPFDKRSFNTRCVSPLKWRKVWKGCSKM